MKFQIVRKSFCFRSISLLRFCLFHFLRSSRVYHYFFLCFNAKEKVTLGRKKDLLCAHMILHVVDDGLCTLLSPVDHGKMLSKVSTMLEGRWEAKWRTRGKKQQFSKVPSDMGDLNCNQLLCYLLVQGE